MKWINSEKIETKKFKCGFCQQNIASEIGYYANYEEWTQLHGNSTIIKGHIYICHECDNPTYFNYYDNQFPGFLPGNAVKHIDKQEVEKLFKEAKKCYSINAFTATVMCCRKLLMNIAVTEGADEGLNFYEYVNFLDDNNYIPPKGKEWVDTLRKLGNEANHSIEFKSQLEAERILTFSEMLLRFIYELPAMMKNKLD